MQCFRYPQSLEASRPDSALRRQSVMMVHFEQGFNLAHRIQIDTDHNDQRRSAHQHSDGLRKPENRLNKGRQYRDNAQKDCAGQYEPIQYPLQVFFRFIRTHAGNGASVFPDVFCNFRGVQRYLSVEVCKKDDKDDEQNIIPYSVRREERREARHPPCGIPIASEHLNKLDRERQKRKCKDERDDVQQIDLKRDIRVLSAH